MKIPNGTFIPEPSLASLRHGKLPNKEFVTRKAQVAAALEELIANPPAEEIYRNVPFVIDGITYMALEINPKGEEAKVILGWNPDIDEKVVSKIGIGVTKVHKKDTRVYVSAKEKQVSYISDRGVFAYIDMTKKNQEDD